MLLLHQDAGRRGRRGKREGEGREDREGRDLFTDYLLDIWQY